MPRKPRIFLPGYPFHIIQRGNNRTATFFSEQDYLYYLECLADSSSRFGLSVHAYVLMTNHVHILASPKQGESISRSMQSIGRRYVQYINKEYRRTGTLWEGRYKCSVVDADNYLLKCYRYIELNPVAVNMVRHPSGYRWSSFHYNASGIYDPIITAHPLYQGLHSDAGKRRDAYRGLFDSLLDKDDTRTIRTASMCSMPTGDNRFKAQIEAVLNRKLGYTCKGRPRKQKHI